MLMARVPRAMATRLRPWSPFRRRDHRTTIFDDLLTQVLTEMCSRRWCRRTSLVLRAAGCTARTPEMRIARAGPS